MFHWAALSEEQMSIGYPFSLLNDEQMSNKVGVEHQPVHQRRFLLGEIHNVELLQASVSVRSTPTTSSSTDKPRVLFVLGGPGAGHGEKKLRGMKKSVIFSGNDWGVLHHLRNAKYLVCFDCHSQKVIASLGIKKQGEVFFVEDDDFFGARMCEEEFCC